MTSIFAPDTKDNHQNGVIAIHICRPNGWEDVRSSLTSAEQAYAATQGFKGEAGQRVSVPALDGTVAAVLFGAGPMEKHMEGPIRAGALSAALPVVR